MKMEKDVHPREIWSATINREYVNESSSVGMVDRINAFHMWPFSHFGYRELEHKNQIEIEDGCKKKKKSRKQITKPTATN